MGRQLHDHCPTTGKETPPRPASHKSVVWLLLILHLLPQHLYGVESEMEETDYDSVEETSSVLSTEEWEDESDSWETDNGLTTEDEHVHSSDVTHTVTPNPTPTSSTVFIIPLQEGNKAEITSPSRGGSGEDWDGPAASPSGAHT